MNTEMHFMICLIGEYDISCEISTTRKIFQKHETTRQEQEGEKCFSSPAHEEICTTCTSILVLIIQTKLI